ncbi:MAG: hypothetical protein K9M80_01810 [Candidatus Marinimicrobia bacterium]|nr:hypothetical protein [Candidatus Neomarinimicrobiota bacterium]
MEIKIVVAIIGLLGIMLPVFYRSIKSRKKRSLDMNIKLSERVDELTNKLLKYQKERLELGFEKDEIETDLYAAIEIEKQCQEEIAHMRKTIESIKAEENFLDERLMALQAEYNELKISYNNLKIEVNDYQQQTKDCLENKKQLLIKIQELKDELDKYGTK